MYEQIDEVIKLSKEKDNLIIMGDWNTVLNKKFCSQTLYFRSQSVEGTHGLCQEVELNIS